MKRHWNLGWVVLLAGCGTDTSPPPPPSDTVTCTETDLAVGCTIGACRVTAPIGTLGSGKTARLRRSPISSKLAGDALEDSLCELTIPPEIDGTVDLSLSVTLPTDGPADMALFQDFAEQPAALVVASHVDGKRVVTGLVRHSGTYGATVRPTTWNVEGVSGVDTGSSGDTASLLRSISDQAVGAAYFDGQRLYVGSGNRLLIWASMPNDASVPPDVVLGQPSLDTKASGTSAGTWLTSVRGIWSDGKRLAVSEGNRVLLWNQVPTASGTPADLVLGQADFGSEIVNSGGLSAQSMREPAPIDSDGTRFVVGDMRNNRVLVWSAFPTSIGQPASSVIGQPDFTTADPATGAIGIYQSWGVALDSSRLWVTGFFQGGAYRTSSLAMNAGADFNAVALHEPKVSPIANYLPAGIARGTQALWVRDMWGRRVGAYRQAPTATAPVDFVLGQPDATRAVWSPTSASTLAFDTSRSIAAHGDVVLVPDGNRLLVFDGPSYHYAPASRVIGQGGFATNLAGIDYRSISKRALGQPADVAVSSGKVVVADRGNNRVLIFDESDVTSSTASAKVVLGQADGGSFLPSSGPARMSAPSGVAFDGTHLVVADSGNHRVLIWNKLPTTDGAAPDLVLGQSDFSGHAPNHGRTDTNLDGFSDAAADGFFEPMGVVIDGSHLAVVDRLNHRVLSWSSWPSVNGQPADRVIGQPSFTEVRPNRGTVAATPAAEGLNLPLGASVSGGSLWISDTENNRVVRWDDPWGAPHASAWLGQADGTSIANPNVSGPSEFTAGSPVTAVTHASSVVRPRSAAVAAGRVFVSETGSNRVHVFDATTLAPLSVIGQPSVTGGAANNGGLGPQSLSLPLGLSTTTSSLYVADSENNRVLRFDLAAPSGATAVLGQSTPYSNGFDRGGAATAGAVSHARGVSVSSGEVFVADTDDNRVLVFAAPLQPGAKPKRVLGQIDANTTLPNGGGKPSSSTLFNPRGVHASDRWIAVADTRNNRVLLFDRASAATSAAIVLGQPNDTSVDGRPAAADSLLAPEGVYVEGERVVVVDTGHHRVLVWNKATATGQPADAVIGQPDASSELPNQGGNAGRGSLLLPSSAALVGGKLFVADTGNNRVLRWDSLQTGALADAVLGQADFSVRVAAVSQADTTHLASPVTVTSDGTFLYVLDRDLGRIMTFAVGSPSGSAAAMTLGVLGGLSLTSPAGLGVERTPYFTTRLTVADTSSSRLVLVGNVSRLR